MVGNGGLSFIICEECEKFVVMLGICERMFEVRFMRLMMRMFCGIVVKII